MVPMGMPDEEVHAEGLGRGPQEVMAQPPGARPAVQNDDRAVIGPDFHARGVPAILGGPLARHGNGPAGSPEAHEQGPSSFRGVVWWAQELEIESHRMATPNSESIEKSRALPFIPPPGPPIARGTRCSPECNGSPAMGHG